MEYCIYKLEFMNGVRFGSGTLNHTEITFHADTFFAALFQEALKLGKERTFLEMVENGKLLFSDAFPYKGKTYFIPKPIFQPEVERKLEERGDSRKKKQLKNMKYIPYECVEFFMTGELPGKCMEDMKKLGSRAMKVSVGISGNEEPMPYRVSAFYFQEGAGLYIILGYESQREYELFDSLLYSLSYSGLGGKKSAGLGRFEPLQVEIPEKMKHGIEKCGKYNLLLSTALPEDKELEKSLEQAYYGIIKRSGFVNSETYASQQMKKRDLYVMNPGSCFKNRFSGQVVREQNGGEHPVYRYEKAMFLGVDV